MQARQKSCCISFLIPTQLPNLNVLVKPRHILLLPRHIWAPELCTFLVCNGHTRNVFEEIWMKLKADSENRNKAALIYCLHLRFTVDLTSRYIWYTLTELRYQKTYTCTTGIYTCLVQAKNRSWTQYQYQPCMGGKEHPLYPGPGWNVQK
jgi:hypothetical protein